MSQGFFITGTDTGVGKTHCSIALLRAFNRAGFTTAAMKPIASGASPTPQGLRNDDALQLMKAASTSLAYEQINPYCFEPAIAPHIAARLARQTMSIQPLLEAYAEITAKAEVTIVEGVGGWLVPINDQATTADLARALNLPVILVVAVRLGCLSHALLTVQAIQQSGLSLAGWIANLIEPDCAFSTENITYLNGAIASPLLGIIPLSDRETPLAPENFLDITRLSMS